MSEIQVRNAKGQFIKGLTSWNKDTRGVMKPNSGSFKKGEHRSPKTEFKKGQATWIKGLTAETDLRVKRLAEKSKETKRIRLENGEIQPSFIGKHHTQKTKDKISEAKKKNPTRHWKGKHFSEIHRNNMSKARKGVPNPKNSYPRSGATKKKISKAKKGQWTGELNPLWKGGITGLHKCIRELPEYINWRTQVYKRDYYACRICGEKSPSLIAHHTPPFKELLQEFLSQYDQFSPIEDRETLLRLAMKYGPFWDVDNGITHCRPCHCRLHVVDSLLKKHKIISPLRGWMK